MPTLVGGVESSAVSTIGGSSVIGVLQIRVCDGYARLPHNNHDCGLLFRHCGGGSPICGDVEIGLWFSARYTADIQGNLYALVWPTNWSTGASNQCHQRFAADQLEALRWMAADTMSEVEWRFPNADTWRRQKDIVTPDTNDPTNVPCLVPSPVSYRLLVRLSSIVLCVISSHLHPPWIPVDSAP